MTAIAIREPATGLTREQIDLIKDTIAKDATDEELRHFIAVCDRLGLDPFAKQIYLVKRWDNRLKRMVATPQVSIDGFRVVAERTGQYRGQTQPQWCGYDGQWVDVWLLDEPPQAARVGVWREGNREPLFRPALLRSFLQTNKDGSPAAMWRSMPEVMLLKCAEAQALRAAFPNHLGGVYTSDEMGQADNHAPAAIEVPQAAQLAPVVPIEAGYQPVSEQERLAYRLANKLDRLRTEEEFLAWTREVLAAQFPEAIKGKLRTMFGIRCKQRGHNPHLVAKEAARQPTKLEQQLDASIKQHEEADRG